MHKSNFLFPWVLIVLPLLFTSCKDDTEDTASIPVKSIEIQGNNINGAATEQFTAAITPANATNKGVTWSVSDAEIASISATGLLTPKSKNGTTTVIATAKDGSGIKGEKAITISGFNVPVSEITISGNAITDGGTSQLTATVLPENASNKELTWSVSDETIASISEDGLLTAHANGQVTVTATATDGSGTKGTIEISVSGVTSEPVEGVVVANVDALRAAVSAANPGDIIYIRQGTYAFTTKLTINRSGTEAKNISLLPHPDNSERPKFDFSAMPENSSNQGIVLQASYWHIKGIDVFKAGDNGMQIRNAHHNIIEFCTFSECADSGLQIDNGSANNLILNCDSFYNADSSVENADGFACKLTAGTGNKFIGCRAWQNLDDGWDGYLRGTDNITTTYENCWAFKNGYSKSGAAGKGDGNGFKTGGSDEKTLKHNAAFSNCIAAGNRVKGFDHNSNRGEVTLYNCIAHNNGTNMGFGSTNPLGKLTIKNSAVLGATGNVNATSLDVSHNSWQLSGVSVTAEDFGSIDLNQLSAPRKADGSLPDITYLYPVAGSDLIDKGTDTGLPYNGTAPDLGAFEYGN